MQIMSAMMDKISKVYKERGKVASLWTKKAALVLTAQLLKYYHKFLALRAT